MSTEVAELVELVGSLAAWDGELGAGDDAARVDQLDALERLKAACAAAQARITARFVESQAQIARDWHQRAAERSQADDFEGWRAAREQARRAEFDPVPLNRQRGPGRGGPGRDGTGRGGSGRGAFDRAGVAAQVGLARHESPARGARLATTALALTRDLPHTLAALSAGVLNERRAELVARLTSHLRAEQRAAVDAEVIGAAGATAGRWGDRELERRVRACTDRIDAAAALARARTAESERHVSIRPIPDTMAIITAILPVTEAVGVYAALTGAADHAKATGDPRTRGQVMADTLTERVLRTDAATPAAPAQVPVEVQLVITDRALLAGDDTPAHIPGYGPVPAGWARDLLTRSLLDEPEEAHLPNDPTHRRQRHRAKVWLRRLYTHPDTGTLVALDSRRRLFPPGLRRFLITRDGTCRTPWCDAPIRHADHVTAHQHGGPTTDTNGQGLCTRCNLVKEQPGWHTQVTDPGPTTGSPRPHTITITTPTGHTHTHTAPPILPAPAGPPEVPDAPSFPIDRTRVPAPGSPFEVHFADLLAS